jgi:flagellar biosynthesis/type III secretory pathway M-ring protein FliF/YscJ
MKEIIISKQKLNQIVLLIILSVCLGIAVFVIKWANKPEQRPLIQNILMLDAVKIIDALEMSKIPYTSDLANKMIFVNSEDMDKARLTLASIGYVVEYPDVTEMANSNEACKSLEARLIEQALHTKYNKPIFEQIWFIKVLKLMLGALIIIVIILSVIRPALHSIIYTSQDDDE